MANDILELAQNAAFLDELYEKFLQNPTSVDESWRRMFETGGAELPVYAPAPTNGHANGNGHAPAVGNGSAYTNGNGRVSAELALTERRVKNYEPRFARVYSLVDAFRKAGHLQAQIDPLGKLPREMHPELDPKNYGFTDADLDRVIPAGGLRGVHEASLREILRRLQTIFCGTIGFEALHIPERERRTWLWDRIEPTLNHANIDRTTQIGMLKDLAKAELFEQFVHTKFVGTKRFSLEGGDTLIPLLNLVIERAAQAGIEEAVLGMAHRGRLNVLANVMGKSPGDIFNEFDDVDPETMFGGGDVKYHLGYSQDRKFADGRSIHLSLAFNPSHLEAVDPVVVGRVRAKQRRRGAKAFEKVLGILVHGDAAFAGQGLVAEVLNLQNLRGYRTGGTVHVIVNNQIGFTTSPPDSRSTPYCTDIAKMTGAPIFHVNGEDPDAVAQVIDLAMGFRREFNSDVIIDMYCYRKYGHNEGDEPAFTQPLMYRAIRARKPVREAYLEHLLRLGGVSREEADEIAERARAHLEQELSVARGNGYKLRLEVAGGLWTDYKGGPDGGAHEVDTGLARPELARLLEESTRLPEGFTPHAKIARWLEQRVEMARGAQALDWAAGEALAFASLVVGGTRVRLSGQDSARGTFSHRHMVLHDAETGAQHCPLARLEGARAPFEVHNSPLSEIGVLGFEYGYSLDWPDALVLWEAQFGDFCNVAQVIIDQFLVSAEEKWRRLSGLVLLLPHGFEGQGPEHSSARLERFLTLASEDNIQVAQPTTPAQLFHLMRRQALRRWRKPLVVMTPKSLLRHARAVSSLDELAQGRFQRVLPDKRERPRATGRVLLCSGKLYYELEEAREQQKRADVAILRLEQLYPLGEQDLAPALADYKANVPVMWVQEEPQNMGAWRSLQARFGERLLARHPFSGITRPASASPATGSSSSHKIEQRELIEQAFA